MKRVTLVWIFKKTYNMTHSSARTDRFGHFEMVDVIAKTTSRDSLGGIFETSIANIYSECSISPTILVNEQVQSYLWNPSSLIYPLTCTNYH